MPNSYLSTFSKDVREKASKIQLLALDVDGILTDGKLYLSSQGDELKAFNILDGLGLKLLSQHGIDIAIITGRTSPLVARRARELSIEHVLQGRQDKLIALNELASELNIEMSNIAYMGDDLPDLSAINAAGLGITVPTAHPIVQQHADCCSTLGGGQGSVREICDLILDAKNLLNDVYNGYLG